MDHYRVNGVHVQHSGPSVSASRPPLIFVHGGLHGSWNWHRFVPVFSQAGWECHALDWYGHHESDSLPVETFIRRSIADVTEEIGSVAERAGQVPVLLGHSMGTSFFNGEPSGSRDISTVSRRSSNCFPRRAFRCAR